MMDKKSLGLMSIDELNELILAQRGGKEIDYDIKHVMGELLFRDMMEQWEEDSEEIEEAERRNDEGCGHDQNENYYGQED